MKLLNLVNSYSLHIGGFFLILFLLIRLLDSKNKHPKDKNKSLKSGPISKENGIIFGKKGKKIYYSPTDDEGMVAVFAPTGGGKTSAILIPTLQHWTGSSLVVDISGDISKNVPDIENKLVFAPDENEIIPYDVFFELRNIKDIEERDQKIQKLATLLMPDLNNASDSGIFFQEKGRMILIASLLAFYEEGYEFTEICHKVTESSWQQLFNLILRSSKVKAKSYIKGFQGTSDRNIAGCKQACDSVLQPFATNMKIEKALSAQKMQQNFNPSMLEKHNIFLMIPDYKLDIYAPLLNLIIAQCLEYFSKRDLNANNTILFAIDEFSSFNLNILSALQKYRKRKVRIMILTQSVVDLDIIYGREKRIAMMNNFIYKVILGATDPETQEYFAKIIGTTTTTLESVSRNGKSITRTQSEHKDWTIPPEELAYLNNELILLHPDGCIKLKKNFYFENT